MRQRSALCAGMGAFLRSWRQGRALLFAALLMCLPCGPFAGGAGAASAVSELSAPLKAVVEVAARPFPLIMPLSYQWARGAAWLNALKSACTGLGQGAHLGLAASGLNDVGGSLAICARLHSIDHLSSWDSPEPLVVVRLEPRADAASALPDILRQADRLAVLRELLADFEKNLLLIQRGWPASLAEARKKAAELEAASSRLEGLWQALENVRAQEGGWLCTPEMLGDLEKAVKAAPENAALWLLLAEARLQRGLPQASVDSANEALKLLPPGNKSTAVQGRIARRALYLRGLGHWRLGLPALAEADLDASLDTSLDALHPESSPQGQELAERLRARGAVRLLRRNMEGMCADFVAACALGDCEGLAAARAKGQCRPDNTWDAEEAGGQSVGAKQ